MTRIGIMQGRLVPPLDGRLQAFPTHRWEEEFPLAAAARLDCIEWIYDLRSSDNNPICTDLGITRIRDLSSRYGVEIRSLCADYFVEKPLIRVAEEACAVGLERLQRLLSQCQKLGIKRVALPFVDQSAMTSSQDESEALGCLRQILPVLESLGIELHLEASLSPQAFGSFLRRIPHPLLQVNYDSGNSASLGYRPEEEFAAYGARIGSVHIKDRKLGGKSVPLGTGDTDFAAVFRGLRHLDYQGDFILQVARGEPGRELAWADLNRGFVERHWLSSN